MNAYEQLGQFYLGKPYDLAEQRTREPWLLYDSKDLTTHAVCVGMTGSGKTGLCLALLEEAAIDGVPAIAIDPKGDLGNLMLTFPELRPEDFRPWLDAAEAERQGATLDELAAATAAKWRDGLAAWDEDGERIARFRQSADVAIYTPGSSAGLPLALLRSFAAPAAADRGDSDAMRERITSTVSGLLALLGIEADPVRSRDHMLLAMILEQAWRAARDVDLAGLIRDIQSPPFDRVGLVDLEAFYPAKDRFGLAMSLNNLLAHPSFSAWMQGEPLDVERLLYTRDGRPRLSIISIAHLGDAERMFFVTLLLNECVAWMRRQSGTASLRAILYMDEIFGYFPPTANPPSKTPLLTLMKQARAFGLGVMLATQNPVDLDYKGLSNAGTWFLGRLQTERDKARVLDGLEGASAAAGAVFDRRKMEATLASLDSRVFLMNNVHEDEPLVFQTRWILSYLRGPLSRDQIANLMAERRAADAAANAATAPEATDTVSLEARSASRADSSAAAPRLAHDVAASRPVLPPGVAETFLHARHAPRDGERLVYRPAVLGMARMHFASSKLELDAWESIAVLGSEVEPSLDAVWDKAVVSADDAIDHDAQPAAAAAFSSLPAALGNPKTYAQLDKALKDCLYRTRTARLWKNAALKQASRHGESEGEFRARLVHAAHEARDQQIEKLRLKYAPKMASLDDQIRRALERVDRERSQATQQSVQTMVSVGQSILSAVLGRKLASSANVGRAATSVRSASRAARERADIRRAEESVEALRRKRADLEADFQKDVAKVQAQMSPARLEIEPVEVRGKKSEITTSGVTLAWTPWIIDAARVARPAFACAKD